MAAKVTRNVGLSIAVRILVCALALALAGGIAFWLWATRATPASAERADVAARVLAIRVNPIAVQRQWDGFGTATAVDASDVPSRITATVIERPDSIRAGRAVKAGELLVRLDDSDFLREEEIASQAIEDLNAQMMRLDVERKSWSERARVTEQELEIATAEYERAVKALASDAARQHDVDLKRQAMLAIERTLIGTREELDKVPLRKVSLQAQLLREQSTLALARQNVARSRIAAPIDGVLSSVDVDEGESVTAGQRVARIVNLARIEVPLLLPSSARPFIQVGDRVTLESESGNPPLLWPAQVSRIAPDDDVETRTMRVFAEVMQDPAKPGILAPGTFVQGVVTAGAEGAGAAGDATAVEMRSVVPRRSINSQRIMLIENGRVRTQSVEVEFHLHGRRPETGVPDTQWAVLRENLPDGAVVVIDGSRSLPEGSPAEAIVPDPEVAERGAEHDVPAGSANSSASPSSSSSAAARGTP